MLLAELDCVSYYMVTLRGNFVPEEKRGEYYCCEMYRSDFTLTIVLPSKVEGDKVKALLENGILELSLPKVEKTNRYAITIQ